MSINHKYLHFGPVVAGTTVAPELIKELLERGAETTQSNVHELAGHLDHENKYTIEDTAWFADRFKEYFIPYFKKIQSQKDPEFFYGMKPFNRVLLNSAWINYMKKNEYNPTHTHNGTFSFVLYLDVPEEIKEELRNFKGTGIGPGGLMLTYGEEQTNIITAHAVVPTTGDLWVFPASMKHMVHPFRSDVTRILVSGNFYITDILNKGQPIQPGEFTINEKEA
jgi:hypothetical protein